MLSLCSWKCEIFSASFSNTEHFSLPREIDSLAWWLEFIKSLVDASPLPTAGSLLGRLGMYTNHYTQPANGSVFRGLQGSLPARPLHRLPWRVVYIDLTPFKEEKAIFPLENTRDWGVRRLAVKEDALHVDACWLCLEAYSSARSPGEVLAERLKLGIVSMCHFWCDEPWSLVKGIARGQVVYLGVTHCCNFVWFHSWWHLMVCVWILAAAYPRLVLFLSLFLVVPLLAALSPQIETVPIFQTQPMSSSFPKVFLGQIRSTSATFFFFFFTLFHS